MSERPAREAPSPDTRALIRMLEKATVRLGILRDRMEGCNRADDEMHRVSLEEIPAWIEEQRELLRGASSVAPTPPPRWIERGKEMVESLRAHVAAKYPDHQRYKEGDYELGTHVAGLMMWFEELSASVAPTAPERDVKWLPSPTAWSCVMCGEPCNLQGSHLDGKPSCSWADWRAKQSSASVAPTEQPQPDVLEEAARALDELALELEGECLKCTVSGCAAGEGKPCRFCLPRCHEQVGVENAASLIRSLASSRSVSPQPPKEDK